MIEELQNLFINNYIETIASILGLINIYFGIKEKVFFWLLSLISCTIYIYVYANAKIYAFMFLQLYYIVIGVTGLFYWMKGSNKNKKEKVEISHLNKKQIPLLVAIFIALYTLITFILIKFTDSDIPYVDSFITSGSMIAIFLMMRKKIEHWFVWVSLDFVTVIIFFNKKLYATIILYIFYLFFAIIGYTQWLKSMKKQKIQDGNNYSASNI